LNNLIQYPGEIDQGYTGKSPTANRNKMVASDEKKTKQVQTIIEVYVVRETKK
jgi:hypothetical protein